VWDGLRTLKTGKSQGQGFLSALFRSKQHHIDFIVINDNVGVLCDAHVGRLGRGFPPSMTVGLGDKEGKEDTESFFEPSARNEANFFIFILV
jgi:hypothetical protein